MNNFDLIEPTKIFFGKGQIEKLSNEVKAFGTKILFVYGGGSIKKAGLYDEVMKQLNGINAEVFELGGVEPNPRMSTAYKGIAICKKEGIDLILAVGGGSTIDCSKAIAMGAKYDGDAWDFFVNPELEAKDATPIGTVLTIPAAGSEANASTVMTNWDTNEKLAVGGSHIIPRFSILDPEYSYTVPKFQTAAGATDIIIHVFEQYFDQVKDTPLQDRFSESIIKTVIENAPIAIEKPYDYEARANIMMCGTWAFHTNYGKEHDWATHMIEHEVSAIYDITHAAGLSIIWPRWAEYVLSEGSKKFAQYATRVWNVETTGKSDRQIALEGIEKTKEFFKSLGMPTTFDEVNIDDRNFKIMAKKAAAFGLLGSYKKLNADDVEKIYKMCLY